MNITIIGLGLIGGSIALDLKSQLSLNVYGVDSSDSHSQTAIRLGLVHKVLPFREGISVADVVIVATPVDSIETLLPTVMDAVSEGTVVIDVGSTKGSICKGVEHHKNRRQYVAAHPLAGTEYSGPEAAVRGMFRGKKNIICDSHMSDPEAVVLAEQIFESLGMQTLQMHSSEHDKHLAYVSHLSHVTSFTLGLTVLDIEKNDKHIFNLASTGFESTARLAKSNPDTWTAIFDKNDIYLTEALDSYIKHLQDFRDAIANRDTAYMNALMARANRIKTVLNKQESSR